MFTIITNKYVSVAQCPTANNNYHAVCIVNVTTSNGTYSSIGEAQGAIESTAKGLLQQAEEDGFERALKLAEKYSVQSSQSIPLQDKTTQMPVSSGDSTNAGGGNKTISYKQIETLKNLYRTDLDNIVKDKFNTTLYKLKGSQAHMLISEYNNQHDINV
jgi:hypothetical protein